MITTTTPESREAALIRLVDQARTTGVRLYVVMTRRLNISGDEGEATLDIDGNTMRVTLLDWGDAEYELTVEIPEGLRQVMLTLEEFATRPGFQAETGELEYFDDNGEPYDAEPVIKMYDAAHGGGLVWCLISQDAMWGTARGNHAVLPDGTVIRDGTIRPDILEGARDRLKKPQEG